jgi:site-specific DNA-methyltransferase (adenine-specific)
MTPYYADDLVTIYHGDALELPPVTADAFVIDPPYSRAGALHTGRKSTAGQASDSAGSNQFWLYWFRDVARSIAEHTAPSGCGFVFTDYRTISLVERAFEGAAGGWTMSQGLVWDRSATGMGSPFRASHELIGFCRGPDFVWAGPKNLTNVLRFPWPYGAHPNHPAEKPVSLMRFLIETVTAPGALVLDAFTGSGSVLVAAKQTGRFAIGVDLDEAYCERAANRCRQEVLGLGA